MRLRSFLSINKGLIDALKLVRNDNAYFCSAVRTVGEAFLSLFIEERLDRDRITVILFVQHHTTILTSFFDVSSIIPPESICLNPERNASKGALTVSLSYAEEGMQM